MQKHAKLQTIFQGNNMTMCNHIACKGMSDELGHYNKYRERCMEGEIEMWAPCIPDDECEHLQHQAGMSDNAGQYVVIFPYIPKLTMTTYSQTSIMEFTETGAKAPEWTKDELEEQIIHFVIETNQVCVIFNWILAI